MKKLAIVLSALVALGITAAPADARSGWGCGGACKIAHR